MKAFVASSYVHKMRMAFVIGLLPVILLFLENEPAYAYLIVILSTVVIVVGQLLGMRKKTHMGNLVSLTGETILVVTGVIFTGWYASPFLFLFLLFPITYALSAGLAWTYSTFFIFLPIIFLIMLAASIDKAWAWLIYTTIFCVLFFLEVDIVYKWFNASSEQIILLKDKANRDPLTGLFNRYIIDDVYERIENSIHNEICSIVIFDLDDFKVKNDLYGHPVGDKILIKVSEVLQDNIRNKDILLRYGGDEFLLIIWGITSEETGLIISRIKDKVTREADCEISYGIASGYVNSRAEFTKLISTADEDLYHRKPKQLR